MRRSLRLSSHLAQKNFLPLTVLSVHPFVCTMTSEPARTKKNNIILIVVGFLSSLIYCTTARYILLPPKRYVDKILQITSFRTAYAQKYWDRHCVCAEPKKRFGMAHSNKAFAYARASRTESFCLCAILELPRTVRMLLSSRIGSTLPHNQHRQVSIFDPSEKKMQNREKQGFYELRWEIDFFFYVLAEHCLNIFPNEDPMKSNMGYKIKFHLTKAINIHR